MFSTTVAAAAALLSLPIVTAAPHHVARAAASLTWGPVVGLGPPQSGVTIVSILATIYPGNMPKTQAGGLFNWIGITDQAETGDLVQGIVGSYLHGQSECSGAQTDSLWCISSEVYGKDPSTGQPEQFVGDLTTLDTNVADGVTFNYTLVNPSTGLWVQTAKNAKTGALMASFQKTSSGPMQIVNTAVECQSCTPPTDVQYWTDISIGLSAADEQFGSTIYQENHATYTDPTTPDNGKTWKVAKITNPVVTPIVY